MVRCLQGLAHWQMACRASKRATLLPDLLDLAAARLFDLQADFRMLQDAMVKAHAMLAALPTAEPPAAEQTSIWCDQLSP